MIDSYSFGKIVINGQEYNSDVIVYLDHVKNNWWRKSGHILSKDDLREVFNQNPDILVVGTGSVGMLKVPGKIKNFLEEKHIELIVEKTPEACDIFNKLIVEKKNVIGAFHLTC
jgi:hypothetical protein